MTTIVVSSGVLSSFLTISSGDVLFVDSGGVALGTTVSNRGTANVSGAAINTTVDSGGFANVDPGGATTATVVNNGGIERVFGTAIVTTVNSGGVEFVFSGGGSAVATTVSQGGSQDVAGTAIATTVSGGGFLVVSAGGSALGAVVAGSDVVSSGGTTTGTVVNSGGQEFVSAGAIVVSTTVGNGGTENVLSGGEASATTVVSGGTDNVLSGGTASGTIVTGSGTENVDSGGTASGTTLNGGGVANVNGAASGATVNSGGTEQVFGTASGTTISGGTERVFGTATAMTLNGGLVLVSSGGMAIGTTISGGTEAVLSGGAASGATVNSGGTENVDGTTSGATVNSGGTENADSGGTDGGTTVNSGGTENVSSGGTANGTTVNSSGTENVASGGTASGTTVNNGGVISVSGTTSFTTISAGIERVFAGGTASFAAVNGPGGGEVVASGGTAVSATVNSGGEEIVETGGTARFTKVKGGGNEFVLSGGSAISTTVNNGGTENVGGTASFATVDGGGFEVVSGGGTAIGTTVSSGGFEVLSGGVASGSILRVGGPIDVGTLVFVAGASATINAATDVLTVSTGAGSYTQQLAGSYVSARLAVSGDTSGGTVVTLDSVACYAAGTRIATPQGARAVETLAAGDAVLALQDGAWRPARVRWIGNTSVELARHPRPEQAAPVRIRAHAVAPGVPSRDLLVSPDHAIFLDGAFIQARALMNGASVVQEFPGRIRYLHVELDRHAVLLAEDLPAESYLDTGNRALFAGEAGARALHPDLLGAAAWDERACAPLLLGGARVAAAHARVLARAADLGGTLTDDPALTVLADDRLVALDEAGRAVVPADARVLTLASRSFVPAWLGLGDDRRRLGVAVAALRLGGRPLPRAAFRLGWHAAEAGWRWTDGSAALRLPAAHRPLTLRLRLAPVGARDWAGPPARAAAA